MGSYKPFNSQEEVNLSLHIENAFIGIDIAWYAFKVPIPVYISLFLRKLNGVVKGKSAINLSTNIELIYFLSNMIF